MCMMTSPADNGKKNYQSTPLITNSHNPVLGKVFRSWESWSHAGPNVLEYLAGFRKV